MQKFLIFFTIFIMFGCQQKPPIREIIISPKELEVQKQAMIKKHKKTEKERRARRKAEFEKQLDGELELELATQTKSDTFSLTYITLLDFIDINSVTTLFDNEIKIDLLNENIAGKRIFLFVDGRDAWQVALAKEIWQKIPNSYIFHTKRGKLDEIPSYPLDKTIANTFEISVVPTLISQKNGYFKRQIYKRK